MVSVRRVPSSVVLRRIPDAGFDSGTGMRQGGGGAR